jgi:hypothetical protein
MIRSTAEILREYDPFQVLAACMGSRLIVSPSGLRPETS